MDPDVLLEKPRYKVKQWLHYRQARNLYREWMQESAKPSEPEGYT